MKKTRVVGIILLIIAVVYIACAVIFTQKLWIGSTLSFIVYGLYSIAAILLLISPRIGITRIIGTAMWVVAVIFISYALTHPESSWSWNNTITYTLYILYTIVTIILLVLPVKKK